VQQLHKQTLEVPLPALVRDRPTWQLYGLLGLLGFLLNGLGAVLGPLQRQLHVERAAVAFYPSLFAVGLLAVGLVGGPVVARLGHRAAAALAVSGLAAGAVLLASPGRLLTLVGAVALGAAGALTVQVVPAALSQRHPHAEPAALAEANAVSSLAAVLAPAAVASALAAGLNWRIGYLLPVLPVTAALLVMLRRGRPTDPAPAGRPDGAQADDVGAAPGLEPGPLLSRWVDVVLAVSVEFCLVFWAATAFTDWHRAGPAAAPALAGIFLLGMAIIRAAAGRLLPGHHPFTVLQLACGAAAAGFATFWAVPSTLGAAAGLLVTGAGVALLYPVTLARLVAAWPNARDRAAARGALASGVAIGGAPLLLARLSDGIGLRLAYLFVPALLAALAGHALVNQVRADPGRR